MHTLLGARGQRVCLGARARTCESRLWSHTSSSEGLSIRRALGLGSCGRDGRAYLIDPPQYLATSEFFFRALTSSGRPTAQMKALGPHPLTRESAKGYGCHEKSDLSGISGFSDFSGPMAGGPNGPQ